MDNDTDTDWDNVELSVVTGKPVSFIQDLYAPYLPQRPTLPLAIANVARAETYASGTTQALSPKRPKMAAGDYAYAESAAPLKLSNPFDTADFL